jgi:hypothetical protein
MLYGVRVYSRFGFSSGKGYFERGLAEINGG